MKTTIHLELLEDEYLLLSDEAILDLLREAITNRELDWATPARALCLALLKAAGREK